MYLNFSVLEKDIFFIFSIKYFVSKFGEQFEKTENHFPFQQGEKLTEHQKCYETNILHNIY